MKILFLFLLIFLLTGCAAAQSEPAFPAVEAMVPETAPVETAPAESVPQRNPVSAPLSDPIRAILDGMSLEERVGQLFLARCDASTALSHIETYHLGGFVLFRQDFEAETPESFRAKAAAYQAAAKLPLLLAVDEEGGTVTRISSNRAFSQKTLPSPREAYQKAGLEGSYIGEEAKCQLLSSLGLNVNLGPVCDISTNPSAFMYKRSLGQSAQITSQYISGTVNLMKAYGIGSVLKHFPGYGDNADTHTGAAIDQRSLEALEEKDLLPFAAGIDAGAGAVLMSHTIVEAFDTELPVSLSPAAHDYLREVLGFAGVILTDDLAMEAITDVYGAGEAAVLAVLAGNDLLCSTEYVVQYDAVLAAVLDGRIDIDTLNNAVRNVLEWKIELGLIA